MATIRQRDGKFMVLERTEGKQRSLGTFQTLEEAEALVLKRAPKVPAYPVAKRGVQTVAGYMAEWLDALALEPTSVESYTALSKHIVKHLGTKTVKDVSTKDVQTMLNKVAADRSHETTKRVRTVAMQLFKTLQAEGIRSDNPVTNTKVKGGAPTAEMHFASKAEARKIELAIDPHYRLLVRTLFGTGARWGEVLGVKGTDAFEKDGTWYLKIQRTVSEVNGKTYEKPYGKTVRAMRTIPIDPALGADLASYGPSRCFTALRGGDLTRANFRRTWLKATKAAGIKLRVHDCRHSVASWLANSGVPLVAVRDHLGHSDISITSRYLHSEDHAGGILGVLAA